MFDKLVWGTLPLWLVLLVPLMIQAVDPNATDVANFFLRLGNDLVGFLLAAAGFSLMLAAFFLMFANATGNERVRGLPGMEEKKPVVGYLAEESVNPNIKRLLLNLDDTKRGKLSV